MRSMTVIVALLVFVCLADVSAQSGTFLPVTKAQTNAAIGYAQDTLAAARRQPVSNVDSAASRLSLPHGIVAKAGILSFAEGSVVGSTSLALVFLLLITLIFKQRFYRYLLLYGLCFLGLLISEPSFFFSSQAQAAIYRGTAVHILCASLMALFGLLFLRRFMDIRAVAPRLDRLLQILILCYGLVVGFVFLGYGVFWHSHIMPLVSMIAEGMLVLVWFHLVEKKAIKERFSALEIGAVVLSMLLLPGEGFVKSIASFLSVESSPSGGVTGMIFPVLTCFQIVLFPCLFLVRIRNDNKRYMAAAQEQLVIEQQALVELRRSDALRRANAEILTQQELLENQRQQIEGMNAALHQNNQQLSTQNVLLKELHTEKDEMLGIVAHDLKNPLAAIASFANILRHDDGSLTPTQNQEFISHIIESSERMFEIIRNLLDINALERGGLRAHLQPVEISSVLDYAVSSYRERAEEKRITIQTDFAPVPFALGDESLVMQVVDNLLSNAIKYSPHGKKIIVKIAMADAHYDERKSQQRLAPTSAYSSNSSSVIRFEVCDEGPGLTDDDKSKLFGKFARLSAQPTGGEHSTGLGLSIVKKMVDAMDGCVYCKSTAGKGATFIVELPVADYEE